MTASAPARSTARASSGVVAVTSVKVPARRSASSTSPFGTPKWKETTGTGLSRSTASLASYPSSRPLSRSPSSVSYQAASPASWCAYTSTAAGSAYSGCGMKRFTPKGRPVSPRSCLISWYMPSAVLYPAARNPSPPASDTAAASCGTETPPAMGACTIG